jgi:xanthosine utilization system XapX-like protein
MTSRSLRQSVWQIFAVPALVALASVLGLVGALVGDGIWDWLSSICLAIPAAIFGVSVAWRKAARTSTK